jgi:tRNA-splicing ligase RtcB (3'-phosphate/5'-hydroxy nucleic acid ligase)
MEPAYKVIIDKYPKLNHVQRMNHLGTLGTGNRFIEVCVDEARTSGSCCTRDRVA